MFTSYKIPLSSNTLLSLPVTLSILYLVVAFNVLALMLLAVESLSSEIVTPLYPNTLLLIIWLLDEFTNTTGTSSVNDIESCDTVIVTFPSVLLNVSELIGILLRSTDNGRVILILLYVPLPG